MIKQGDKAVIPAALAEKLEPFIRRRVTAGALKLKFNPVKQAFKIAHMLIIKRAEALIRFKRRGGSFKAVCIRRGFIIRKRRGKRHKNGYFLLIFNENAAVAEFSLAEHLCNSRKLHALIAVLHGIWSIIINGIANFGCTPFQNKASALAGNMAVLDFACKRNVAGKRIFRFYIHNNKLRGMADENGFLNIAEFNRCNAL